MVWYSTLISLTEKGKYVSREVWKRVWRFSQITTFGKVWTPWNLKFMLGISACSLRKSVTSDFLRSVPSMNFPERLSQSALDTYFPF